MDDIAVLRSLLEAYSPSGAEGQGVRAFVDAAKALGYRTEVDAVGNGLARTGSGRPQILFLGHIDTVEGELPVRVEDGRVSGRGACDAKGALAAALLAAADHEGPGEVVIAAAVGEERDSRGARHLIPRLNPDLLIVGEPSGWDGVTIGYKGNLSLVLTFEGERAHLSAPTATTVETALAFVERLRAFCEDHRGETPFRSLTAKLHTVQTTRSGGREVVELGVNLRLPPSVRVADVEAFLEENGLEGQYTIADRSEAVEVDRRNAVVRALGAGIAANGGRATLYRKAGTADLNLAVPVWGRPAAAYGPGDSHLDHTDREALDVEEFRRSVAVLRHAFGVLARAPG